MGGSGPRMDSVAAGGSISVVSFQPNGGAALPSVGAGSDREQADSESGVADSPPGLPPIEVAVVRTPSELRRTIATRSPDCVCAEATAHDDQALAVLDSVAEEYDGVATVLWGEAADGRLAAVATRCGVTEYAPLDLLAEHGESFHDRIRAAVARVAADSDRFRALFDEAQDAVVEIEQVDGEPRVLAVNPAFQQLFGWDTATIRGESLNDFILPASHTSEGRDLDRRTGDGEIVREEVRRLTADGLRQFLFAGVPYHVSPDVTRGFAIYTDITDQQLRERQLQVLHRVLRHNLRNDMGVIIGNATDLVDDLDGEAARMASRIVETARSVADLSEQARDLQRLIDRQPGTVPVELAALARRIVEGHQDVASETTLSTDLPSECWVVGIPELGRAIDNVVENAIVHGADNVHVWLTEQDDRIVLHISDDGPGIPAREREVLTGSREMSQLDHSTGLGLWIVRWVVDAAGGRLDFAPASDGADVALRFDPSDPPAH
jgi:PAS domain S-box-containing protein